MGASSTVCSACHMELEGVALGWYNSQTHQMCCLLRLLWMCGREEEVEEGVHIKPSKTTLSHSSNSSAKWANLCLESQFFVKLGSCM